MKRRLNVSLSYFKYESLVLLKEACMDISEVDDTMTSLVDLTDSFIHDHEIDDCYRRDIKEIGVSASSEEFAYTVKDYKKEDLIELREIFRYAYGVSKKTKYKRVVECIDIILDYRRQLLELMFNQAEKMTSENLNFYVQLITKDITDKMADYCEVAPKNLSVEFLKQEYGKVNSLGRV